MTDKAFVWFNFAMAISLTCEAHCCRMCEQCIPHLVLSLEATVSLHVHGLDMNTEAALWYGFKGANCHYVWGESAGYIHTTECVYV